MIYEIPITTTTSYTKDNPKKTVVSLARGVIHELDIISDEAARWTIFIAIAHGIHQIYPVNTPNYFNLRGEYFAFKEWYELDTKPYSLNIYTYLDGADYEHKVIVRIGLLPERDLRGVMILWEKQEAL